ncbi:uncharacterized protein A1O9_12959 [Exophiala aquamarina CBS 119918]|uniref:Zn(2)-C6 fungal-type domain-containing protein n=1 Tax=Exophiala aquamarina CBS 119918 TaxID=1182545 RepID=A0A072NUD3_9EURO|nr:uncharacterized protein A1O9_12959 [Exophiala aquamarina CBS 119918]KEF50982.1 hypothetical protein A1O9_12959 [Exophiala aquamarina CBS 119918]
MAPMMTDPHNGTELDYLPPISPHPGYYIAPQHCPLHRAAPLRQRAAIACKYCRKRKIRCSGYDSSPDGRCQNCVRFNQQCLFHPVSSQAVFVPASAVYGPGVARAPVAGRSDNHPRQNGEQPYIRDGEQPVLYGAHGQPLGPAGPHGQPQYSYLPAPRHSHYPPQPYPYQAFPYSPAAGAPYDAHGQALPAPYDACVGLKRPYPDDDPHKKISHAPQSPHPNVRARHGTYDGRADGSGSYAYPSPPSRAPASPMTSTQNSDSVPGDTSNQTPLNQEHLVNSSDHARRAMEVRNLLAEVSPGGAKTNVAETTVER